MIRLLSGNSAGYSLFVVTGNFLVALENKAGRRSMVIIHHGRFFDGVREVLIVSFLKPDISIRLDHLEIGLDLLKHFLCGNGGNAGLVIFTRTVLDGRRSYDLFLFSVHEDRDTDNLTLDNLGRFFFFGTACKYYEQGAN